MTATASETIHASAAFTSGALRMAFDAGAASARGASKEAVQRCIDAARDEYDKELTAANERAEKAEGELLGVQIALGCIKCPRPVDDIEPRILAMQQRLHAAEAKVGELETNLDSAKSANCILLRQREELTNERDTAIAKVAELESALATQEKPSCQN